MRFSRLDQLARPTYRKPAQTIRDRSRQCLPSSTSAFRISFAKRSRIFILVRAAAHEPAPLLNLPLSSKFLTCATAFTKPLKSGLNCDASILAISFSPVGRSRHLQASVGRTCQAPVESLRCGSPTNLAPLAPSHRLEFPFGSPARLAYTSHDFLDPSSSNLFAGRACPRSIV